MSEPTTEKQPEDAPPEKQRRCSSAGCTNEAEEFAVVFGEDRVPVDLPLCHEHLRKHGLDYSLPEGIEVGENLAENEFEECELHAVIYPKKSWKCSVVLRSKSSPALFEFAIDYIQASAIVYSSRPSLFPAPLTHNLLNQVINALGGAVEEVVLYGYDPVSKVAACHLILRVSTERRTVKCRFSDALAIAAVNGTMPIRVHRGFMNKKWGHVPPAK